MKILFSFIVMVILVVFFGLATTSCQFSTNPKDHGLPTMEEIITQVQEHNFSYRNASPKTQEEIIRLLRTEKEFFYRNVNEAYLKAKKHAENPDFFYQNGTKIARSLEYYLDLRLQKTSKKQMEEIRLKYPTATNINGCGIFYFLDDVYIQAIRDWQREQK